MALGDMGLWGVTVDALRERAWGALTEERWGISVCTRLSAAGEWGSGGRQNAAHGETP